MVLDVVHDHLISDIARASNEVAPRPHMATPECSVQLLVLHQHLARALPFDHLDQLTYRDVWRNRDENMHMVLGYLPLNDFDISSFAYLSYQITRSLGDFASQNWLAVFRDPYDMVLDVIDGMARLPIMFHTASILKSSPEGEGFSPIPRERQ